MSTELFLEDPAVVFALPRESMAFRHEFRPQQRFPGAPCWAHFCGPEWLTVLVMHAGMGKARIARAGAWLLGKPAFGNLPYRPKAVLMAGYAGGLRDGLKVGDVILATEIVDAKGNIHSATWPTRPLDGQWDPPLQRGRLVTVDKIVSTTQEKRDLGQRHDALAVDMESAVLARLCAAEAVPFGCVRVISDSVDTPLPPRLVSLITGDRISIPRTILTMLRHPTVCTDFWRLAKQTRHASQQLGKALGELLTLALPWSDELEQGS
jgi:nucleoside phosphorylase